MFFKTPNFDAALLKSINTEWTSPVLDFIMPLFSSMTVFFIIFAIVGTWMLVKHGTKALLPFLVILVALGITDLTTNQIKHSVHRVRPLNAVPGTRFVDVDTNTWQQRAQDFKRTKWQGTSYVSAHSANMMCLAILGTLLWTGSKGFLFILPLVVGYSRVYLGKHYPTDVIGGWLFGIVIAVVVWYGWRYCARRFGLPLDYSSSETPSER